MTSGISYNFFGSFSVGAKGLGVFALISTESDESAILLS